VIPVGGASRGWRRLAGVCLPAVVLVALAGCAGPRNTLGAGSTACFKALPAAFDAVRHQGRYLGVREVAASRLALRHPEFASLGKETICIVAFAGTYAPGSVQGAPPTASGRYALVAVDAKNAQVEASFVVAQLPLRFGHPV
jgi:hypothetical protein